MRVERGRRQFGWGVVLLMCGAGSFGPSRAMADAAYQALPFSQDWSNPNLITSDADWTQVPGILGYIGDTKTSSTPGIDPQTLTADAPVALDVRANQSDPASLGASGVAEFDGIANRVVALQGSGPADAPFVKLHLNTSQVTSVVLSYVLRDIDDSANNARQQINAQYRIGSSGPWTNIAGSYVSDATTGPGLSGHETPIQVTLPAEAAMQPALEIRIMTTNADGFDEWVGIDDLRVTGDGLTASLLAQFDVRAVEDGLELRWQFAASVRFDRVAVERSGDARGAWSEVVGPRRTEGDMTVALDRSVEPGRTYFYRLAAESEGRRLWFGPFAGATDPSPRLTFSSPRPNPSSGVTHFEFALASETRVRLGVYDLQGRELDVIANGIYPRGRHAITWSAPGRAGLFFVRLLTPESSLVRSVVIGP